MSKRNPKSSRRQLIQSEARRRRKGKPSKYSLKINPVLRSMLIHPDPA